MIDIGARAAYIEQHQWLRTRRATLSFTEMSSEARGAHQATPGGFARPALLGASGSALLEASAGSAGLTVVGRSQFLSRLPGSPLQRLPGLASAQDTKRTDSYRELDWASASDGSNRHDHSG